MAAVLLCACTTPTMITGSWKSPAYNQKNYESIVVAALTSNVVGKSAIERDLSDLLSKENITASRSIDLFPPKMNASDSDKVALMKAVKGKGTEAILTITLLKKETESRYVPGYAYNPYQFGYYRSFGGYYSYWYPYSYNPGYYTENTIYYLETNLYDAKTEELVWSAQSRTYDNDDLASFSKEFSKSIVAKMRADGLLRSESASKDPVTDF